MTLGINWIIFRVGDTPIALTGMGIIVLIILALLFPRS